MSETPESRLSSLGITLPTPATPVANYLPWTRSGSLIVISGQLPLKDGKLLATGKLGDAVSLETGTEAARYCLINLLAQLKTAVGDLSKVTRVVRLGGFISCTPGFTAHASVMNGASDLAVDAFGDAGRHARSTVGVPSLPLDAPVEVEGMFEVG
ncbi:RidA family protein [Acetobacter musti]|uniref:RidA family protein n=1 Tax=Acetobacter musti TaxID=864732 RepID=A0ABX0JQN1_9PROT|nr:RidA family protein [Acetobacter musti]NHN84200.1 RidA family protein [Acetobacter musti]